MLQGDTLVLREWREPDLDALAVLRNDIDLQTLLMTQATPNSADRVRTWLTQRSSREDMIFFVMSTRADDRVVGYLQVTGIDRFHGHGELGICLSDSAQGRGLAREACDLLESYLRQTLSLRKLILKVLNNNVRAITFYRKYGYRDVGILDRHFRAGDQYHDVLIMERHLGT